MGADYAREKLWQAIHIMVTGAGDVQDRLAAAATYLNRLQPKQNFPEEYQEQFQNIVHDLTNKPAIGGEGAIQATMRKMSDEEARRLAGSILSLYTQMKGGI